MSIGILLIILALVCFLVAAFGVNAGRVNLTALGLAFMAMAAIIGSGVIT